MLSFSRTDTSVIGQWWWTIDRWTLVALLALLALGAMLSLAASPAVAAKYSLPKFHFVERQTLHLALAMLIMCAISLCSVKWVRRIGVVVCALALLFVALTLLMGTEINGASRWLRFAGFSLQPSEFLKPGLAIVAAWMFAESRRDAHVPGNQIAFLLLVLATVMLICQPDIGMTFVLIAVWAAQLFLAGLPLVWVGGLALVFIGVAVLLYFSFSHVAFRIDNFFSLNEGVYQNERAMDAFAWGGLFGRGPAQGDVKVRLPDAHTDFIFAVAGEEFGLLVCLLILGLYAFVVLRGFRRTGDQTDLFVLLAAAGLLMQFGFQALINIGVSLSFLPNKGMTLPFISYGGSSMFALALGMGMFLALTRRRPSLGVL